MGSVYTVNVRIKIECIEFSKKAKKKVAGNIRFEASLVQGTTTVEVGNKDQDFTIPVNRKVKLNWAGKIKSKGSVVKGRHSTSDVSVKLRFKCFDQTDPKPALGQFIFSIHKKGKAWKQEFHKRTTLPNGNFTIVWTVYLRVDGKYKKHDPNAILAAREHAGSVKWSTVSGVKNSVYLGIVPVVPRYTSAECPQFPPVVYDTVMKMNPNASPGMSAASPINVLHNQPLIPMLSAADATTQTAARIEYTFYAPEEMNFKDDDKRLEWRKVSGSGDVAFVAKDPTKPNRADRGLKVLVRGTTDGEVVLGVYFAGKLLTKYRALVKPIKKLPCRFNLLEGRRTLISLNESKPLSTVANVEMHRKMANMFLRQVGVELVPDTDATLRNKSKAKTTTITGIFTEKTKRKYTRNANTSQLEHGLTLNYRDKVLNFTYLESGTPGTLGEAEMWPGSKLGNRAAGDVTDDGSPSSSWVRPTGLKPEADAETATLKIISGIPKTGHPDLSGMVIVNACGADPGGVDALMYAAVIAHEVGHMLCLGHRVEDIADATLRADWNTATLAPAADAAGAIPALAPGTGVLDAGDGMFCDMIWHPRSNNIMHYCEGVDNAKDFDILQAMVVQESPLLDWAV